MPTISAFLGIVVRMYYDDHPPPHFHALYQNMEVKVEVDTLEIIDGRLPPRMLRRVLDWADTHRAELQENWIRAQRHARLTGIPPLE
jgi:hypothetical protein